MELILPTLMSYLSSRYFFLKDDRKDYKENRYIGMGYIQQRIMVIVFTRPKKDRVRVVSLRKANIREQEKFKSAIQN